MEATTRPSAVRRLADRAVNAVHLLGNHVPAALGGQLHRLPPRLTMGITGPFNGQKLRVAAVAAMFEAVPFATVIETGTFRGLTTRHLRSLTSAPIATIEVNQGYADFAQRRLRHQPNINQFVGDSPSVLARLRDDAAWQQVPAFFYLDAHWLDQLPLLDELHVIRSGWSDFVALVDDFKVETDGGYFYDDYGPGKTLALGLLMGQPDLADLVVFWPSAEARKETGARRGWVVLATAGSVATALAGLAELRAGGTVAEADKTAR